MQKIPAKSLFVFALMSLSTIIVTTRPAKTQSAFQAVNCSTYIVPGRSFTVHHIFSQTPHYFRDPVVIENVNGQQWQGRLGSSEAVSGTISGSIFSLRRASSNGETFQSWNGTCFAEGIAGSATVPANSADRGTFVMKF